MSDQQIFRKEEMLPVSKVRKLIPGKNGGPCSRQHVYNLIDQGMLSPAFRFGKSKCVFVPRPVVEEFVRNAVVEPGV